MTKKVLRLYEQFQPEHYDLSLTIDSKAMTFSGKVIISGQKVGRPSQRLTFHQHSLRITAATIVRNDKKGGQVFEAKRINNHSSFDEVRLHAGQMLYPGSYSVTMEFKGKITRSMNGIYACTFKRGAKQQKLIATQFESHHAREAFPCIDEPEAKATFDLKLTTVKSKAIISNTPIKTQFSKGDMCTTTFETTPIMSTYLLAFVYGNMEYLEAQTKAGVVVRSYATPDNVAFTNVALSCAVKMLEYYNDYFDTPYPLAKCDLIALPDFASGAMENWGCITFREQSILVDPKNTSLPVKQYVAMVMAHELAHQWFGNLVTMRWWTDLWLNEGFASWIEYLAVDHLYPDWRMWTQFIVDEQEQGLRLDALEYSHPIEVPIKHPDEIRTIFDAISYCKGSSVIRMLHDYLGAEPFRDGLRHYLKKHAYSNTNTVDLWAALEHVSKKPVKDFMHAWTAQPGYPIVQAKVAKNEIALHQERFHINPKASVMKELWPIPLGSSARVAQETINGSVQSLPILKASGPLIVNSGHSGFYRTVYDPDHVALLGKLIEAGQIDELDRLGLLSDTVEAAKAGYLPTVHALKLLAAYAAEDSSVVWDIIGGLLGSIRATMDDDALREAMKPFVRQITAKQLQRLGWEPKPKEPYFDTLLRPTILGMASVADHPSVVKAALQRFKSAKKPEDIAPDFRGLVYGTAARKGGQPEFDKLLAAHNASNNSEERVTLAAALTHFEQPELIQRALSMIDTDAVRLQDVGYWVGYSFMNRYAKQATWAWLGDHWDWLESNLGSDLSFYRIPNYAAQAFSDDQFLLIFKKFFKAHTANPALVRPVAQSIETIEWQSAWRKRDLVELKKFFKA